MKQTILILVGFFIAQGVLSTQHAIKVVSYNVENLFDWQHDTLKNDSSFLPDGDHHWTYHKYQTKVDQIAQVIVNISGWESVPLVGLCEVENAHCLRDLCYHLKRFHYKYIHYESADERGIDVALLYDSTKVKILENNPLHVDIKGDKTRDILYACCVVNQKDTLHTMVCHLPSQLGGAATEWKRKTAKEIIQKKIDQIITHHPNAKIVVMGDMNSEPKNDLKGMTNQMIRLTDSEIGTHKYQGKWSYLDQFYVSDNLKKQAKVQIFSPEWLLEEDTKYLGTKPKRTFVGYRYHGGYSDHLPVVLTLDPTIKQP